ncbi:hypothetical protein GPECTOR_1g555 [Gonium pectorale]|uniref:General transcription and DNA repair factor IIH subunit TFB4 n=1 Tax=Gonium pectorale TaxID=33097 RepID=A0A150H369_GONPE|nr:hypothetical protein GPECTOR_1g555 [Gonium pectorale]|eukprot:KXZ56616.1 hypothetical protein GPECTOR_1g555 [Gonium pectorale]
MADADGDLLVLLLDLALLRPDSAAASALDVAPAEILTQILAFVNAYTMLSSRNCLAVFAGGRNMCHLLHLGLGEGAAAAAGGGGGGAWGANGGAHDEDEDMGVGGGLDGGHGASVFPAAAVHGRLSELIARCSAAERADPGRPPPPASFALSGALSRALCLIHRLQTARQHHPMLQPDSQPAGGGAASATSSSGRAGGGASSAAGGRRDRVLVLYGSSDSPMQYIPVMNAIFSAQRAQVALDAVVLGAEDSSFLQQAAHLSGGLYFRPTSGRGLLGVLLNNFVADTGTRGQLDAAQALGVDFRASCFCHKFVIETGYVCSVCLSIFCRPSAACSTCGTEFGGAGAGTGAGPGGG